MCSVLHNYSIKRKLECGLLYGECQSLMHFSFSAVIEAKSTSLEFLYTPFYFLSNILVFFPFYFYSNFPVVPRTPTCTVILSKNMTKRTHVVFKFLTIWQLRHLCFMRWLREPVKCLPLPSPRNRTQLLTVGLQSNTPTSTDRGNLLYAILSPVSKVFLSSPWTALGALHAASSVWLGKARLSLWM